MYSVISMELLMCAALSICLSVVWIIQDSVAIYQWSYKLHVLPYNNSRMADCIFMNCGVNIMPLEATPALFSFLWSLTHCDRSSFIVVVSSSTITPLHVFFCGIGDIIANDATYQWPRKLFMLSSISDRMDYLKSHPWEVWRCDHRCYVSCCSLSVASVPSKMLFRKLRL